MLHKIGKYWLNDQEKKIIFSLSVIPYSFYTVPELYELFQISEEERFSFFDLVHDLSSKGLLQRDSAKYALKSEVSTLILQKHKPTFDDCSTLINSLIQLLDRENLNLEKDFEPAYHKLKFLFENIEGKSFHLAQLSYQLSLSLVKFEKYDEALKYNQLAVEISEEIDEKHPSIATFYRNKALIHKKLGDNQMSIFYCLKDIEILEKNAGKYDHLLPVSYFNLSKNYENIKNYEKAIEYNLKAIRFEKKRRKTRFSNLSGLYHNLAYYYLKSNNLRSASLFIDKAVESFSLSKIIDNEQYKILLRDQRRFKSLYHIERIIVKIKYPLLLLISIIAIFMIWGVLKLII